MNNTNKKGRKPVAELHYKNASANLPIRKALTDLSVQFGRSTQKFPMYIKTTECYNINIKIEQIIYLVTCAQESLNDLNKRLLYINKAIEYLKQIEISIQLFSERKLLKNKGFSAIILKEDEAMRQLDGWKNATIKNLEKAK